MIYIIFFIEMICKNRYNYIGDKMKKYLCILSCLIVIIFITGCGKKNLGEISKYKIDNDKVVISVKQDTLTKTGTTIIMENKTDDKFNYGAAFHLEKKSGRKWYIVKPVNEMAFTMMAYEILAGESKEIKIDWEYGYEELPKGKYRIVKTMYDLDNPDKEYNIAAEFRIK